MNQNQPISLLRIITWLSVALLGASALGIIALHLGETINSFWFIVTAVCVYRAVGRNSGTPRIAPYDKTASFKAQISGPDIQSYGLLQKQ
jgi:hypothetical protein